MQNIILALILTLAMFIIPACANTKADNTTPPAGATIPAKAQANQAVIVKATTAADGSELTSVAAVNQKIADNQNLIVLLQQANIILKQKAQTIETAIQQAWLYGIAGFFALLAIVSAVYGLIMAPIGTKSVFIKLGVAFGLVGTLVVTLAAYLPTIFVLLKFFFIAIALVVVGAAVYYFDIFFKALHSEGINGNLSADAEKLPVLGSLIAKANSTVVSSVTGEISGNAQADVVKAEGFWAKIVAWVKSLFKKV